MYEMKGKSTQARNESEKNLKKKKTPKTNISNLKIWCQSLKYVENNHS